MEAERHKGDDGEYAEKSLWDTSGIADASVEDSNSIAQCMNSASSWFCFETKLTISMNQKPNHNHDVRVLILLLACAGVVVMGCLVLNGFTWARLQKSASEQNAAFDRLTQYSAVLSCLQDIELGQRGYLLTGDEQDLDVFTEAVKRFGGQWSKLVALESSDGDDAPELNKLQEASQLLIQDSTEMVSLAGRLDLKELKNRFSEVGADSKMSEVRYLYKAEMDALEDRIRERNYRAEDDFQAGLATSMVMGLLALGLGAIAFSLLRRVLKEIERSERYALSMLKAEENRRQKDVFLAMMSHEIRTPLNAIIGFGQMAEREEMGAKGKRYVKSILEGGESLLVLINDILDLSKLQAGRMELKKEPTNLREMLSFLNRLFKENCQTKEIGFHLEIQDELPEVMVLDSARLRQVLINLVGNAVKFTDEGEVSVAVSGNREIKENQLWRLMVEITDTGRGISKENLAHVFEPFYQSKEGDVSGNKGTGLGLSIVQRFVKLMDGEISVKSEPGEGTSFSIEFRNIEVSDSEPHPAELSKQPIDLDELRSSKILAVDDNETNRKLIREIFSNSHHQIVTADNGEKAVRMVAEESPDLILMDLRMPVKDGPTAAKEIKNSSGDHRRIPIIAVSAGSLPQETGADFDGSLRKPFTREELYRVLSKFLPLTESADDETSVAGEDDYEEEISSELLLKLDELLVDEWVDAKSEMVVSKVIEFTKELQEIAAHHKCQRLEEYVSRIGNATDHYSFSEMEGELARFPDLVSELKETRSLSDV
jgi:signal transduction histidine kinase/CheY-like chemotaxis protein